MSTFAWMAWTFGLMIGLGVGVLLGWALNRIGKNAEDDE